jgi:hypothetical protein
MGWMQMVLGKRSVNDIADGCEMIRGRFSFPQACA